MTEESPTKVFVLLSKGNTALKVVQQAEIGTSSDPVVRAIIDNKLGTVFLGVLRPADDVQTRIIQVETENAQRTRSILSNTQGIERVFPQPHRATGYGYKLTFGRTHDL